MIFRFLIGAVLGAALILHACETRAEGTPPRQAEKFRRDVTRNARLEFGLDAPVAMLAAQLEQESGWNEAARSPVGALGVAQFMPMTARELATKIGSPAEPLNAAWALRAHARYMRDLFNAARYNSECDAFGAALSSYNGGLGWHNKRRKVAANREDFWSSVRFINPGISEASQRENMEYPFRIVYERQPKYSTWGRMVCL